MTPLSAYTAPLAGETWYEVAVDVEPPLVERFERFMRETHIPGILATGCFREIRFDRATATRFRTVYVASTRADLERYFAQHTARFRAAFAHEFPMGAAPTREVWGTVQRWTSDAAAPAQGTTSTV